MRNITKSLFVFIIFFIFLLCIEASTMLEKSPKVTQNTRSKEVYQIVNTFFDTWLVQKDLSTTLNLIAPEALKSRYILSESCANYIKDENRGDINATTEGILEFLADCGVACDITSLNKVFTTFPTDEWNLAQKSILNDNHNDRFALISGLKKQAIGNYRSELKSTFSNAVFFTVFCQLLMCNEHGETKIPFYLVVAQDSHHSFVVNFGVFCQ